MVGAELRPDERRCGWGGGLLEVWDMNGRWSSQGVCHWRPWYAGRAYYARETVQPRPAVARFAERLAPCVPGVVRKKERIRLCGVPWRK